MRIIAGEFRGRRIHSPAGSGRTRPITDRVKQSLFDRLTAMEVLGGQVLDLFAGTGSLGLEALSRGADHCTFVEQDQSARQRLEQNLDMLGIRPRATVAAIDLLARGSSPPPTSHPIRLVYCDPPYRVMADRQAAQRLKDVLERIAPRMESGGLMVLRTDAQTAAPAIDGWQEPAAHRYGSMAVHLYVTTD